jgi:MFS family permease
MTAKTSPFDIANVRLFIAFRVFFNSRFYYPVFAILFLDFGLTLSQFAILNAAWAISIVCLEVPSGALADVIGRRKLMVLAGVLMVIELALLCFAPRGNADLLFGIFLLNRVLSGAAEAAASGADEAIAYDSLKAEGNPDDWDLVLSRQVRITSLTRIGSTLLGAAVYDASLMQAVSDYLGLGFSFSQDATLRLPLFLTLLMALGTLYVVMRMKEPPTQGIAAGQAPKRGIWQTWLEAFRVTLLAGRWILKTPFALMIILSGMFFDHIIRMLGTMNSQYFRLIDLPEASYGLIGSARSLLGLVIPFVAVYMLRRFTPRQNLQILALVTFSGFYGMTFFWPYLGLAPFLLLSAAMQVMSMAVSSYLNRITQSHQRATVLSFKGLSFNLAYGLIGVMYALLLAHLRERGQGLLDLAQVFKESVGWFPWYFLAMFIVLIAVGAFVMRRNGGALKTY